jgi:hypothetical protein
MKYFICSSIFVIIIFCFSPLKINSQTWQWAHSLHNVRDIKSVVLSNGTIITVGTFTGACKVQNTIVNSGPNSNNLLLAGFSSEGVLLWTNTISSAPAFEPYFLVPEDDHFILGATFESFLSGLLNDYSSTGNFFLAKISSSGQVISYKKEGGQGRVHLYGLHLADDGSLITSGTFLHNTTFSGNVIQGDSLKLHGFLTKYDSFWNSVFTKNISSSHSYGGYFIQEVSTDSNNEIYLTSILLDTVKVSADTTFYVDPWENSYNLQTWKFSQQGKLLTINFTPAYANWRKGFVPYGNYSLELFQYSGNHLTNGTRIEKNFNDNSNDWRHGYGANYYSGAPNTPLPPTMTAYALSSSQSKLYYSSTYSGTFALGNNFTLNNSGMYIAKMDHSGNYEKLIVAEYEIEPAHLSNIFNEGLIVSGTYLQNAVLGGHQLDTSSVPCGFIAKLSESLVGINESNYHNLNVSVYPNPGDGLFNYNAPQNENTIRYKVYDAFGSLIFAESSSSLNNTIDLRSYPKGVYFVNFTSDKSATTKKLVVK